MGYKLRTVPAFSLIFLFVFSCVEDNGSNGNKGGVAKYTLTITKPENGMVTNSLLGIKCGSGGKDCEVRFDEDTSVTLTAIPNTGHVAGAWEGACRGLSYTCTLSMDSDKTVGLKFFRLPAPVSAIPNAPGLTLLAGDTQVELYWTRGYNRDENSDIIKYQYRASTNGGTNWSPDWTDISNSTSGEINATSFTVTGLVNGTAYTFEVRAINPVGNGIASLGVSVTPKALTAPDAPDDLTALAGNTQISLSWIQGYDGGSDIIKHQYRASTNRGTNWSPDWTDISNSASGEVNAESFTVTSLVNDTAYTFEVRAINDFDSNSVDDPGAIPSQVTATPTAIAVPAPPRAAEARIDTKGGTIVDDPKIPATLKLIDESGSTIFQGNIGIEYRGSSSRIFPKKSYGFETWDKDGNDIDVALAGFQEEEDWIFYAPYSDKSLIRNVLMYELSNDIKQYASQTRFFDLYMNGDFLGCYVLMEKPKRDKNRINVSKKGFVLKLDKTTGGGVHTVPRHTGHNSFPSKFSSKGVAITDPRALDIWFLFDYPDPDDISEEQRKDISTYMNDLEMALFGAQFKDKTHGYNKWIGVASFIDYFLMNEFSRDVDAFRYSTYMHKEESGKLKMGPIWDFNLALGNASFCGGNDTEGWAYLHDLEHCPEASGRSVPYWWKRLLEDPNWVRQLKTRWASLRRSTFATAAIHKKIDDKVSFLKARRIPSRNFAKWDILGVYVWPNSFIGKTYREEIDYLKDWSSKRLMWMEGAINNL